MEAVKLVLGNKYLMRKYKLLSFCEPPVTAETELICVNIIGDSRVGEFVYAYEDGSGCVTYSQPISIHRDNLLPLPPKVVKSPCTCDIFVGPCHCGAMDNEMASKGLVRCRYTKLWVSQEEAAKS